MASVFTWEANAAVPSNPMAVADTLASGAPSVLSADGSRSFYAAEPTVLLPVSMWGASSTGIFEASATSPYGSPDGIAMGVISPPFDMVGGARGGGGAARAARDGKWLVARGFGNVLSSAPASARAIRSAISEVESRIASQGLTDAQIVGRYVRNADWRAVGPHLAVNPRKLRAVHATMVDAQSGMRWFKHAGHRDATRKLAAMQAVVKARVAEARAGSPPVRLALTLKGDEKAKATLELARSGAIRRVVVSDLTLSPTLAFVTRIMHDLELSLAPSVQVVVGDKPFKDAALLDYIRTQAAFVR